MASFGQLVSIKKDGSNGGEFSITKKEITFGSLVTCDVRLNIPGVEQTHCTLLVHPNSSALLRNFSTSNPVKVNGKPVLKNALLQEGDKISILHRTFMWQSKPVKVDKTSRKSVAICVKSPARVKMSKKRKSEPLLSLTRLVAVVSPVRRSIEAQSPGFGTASPNENIADSSSQEVKSLSQNITLRRRGNVRTSTSPTQQSSCGGAVRKSILKTTTTPRVRKSVTFRPSLSRSCKSGAENTPENHVIWNVPRTPGNPEFDASAVSSSDSGSLSLIDLTNYTSSDINSYSADASMISEYLATPAKSFKDESRTSPNKSKPRTPQQTPYSLLSEMDETTARSLLSPFDTRRTVAGRLATPYTKSSTKPLISFDTPATTSTMAEEISLISFNTPAVTRRSGAKSPSMLIGSALKSASKTKTPKSAASVKSKSGKRELTPSSQTKIPTGSSSRTKVLQSPKLKLDTMNKTPAKIKPKAKDETPRRSTKLIRLKKKPAPATPVLNLGDVFKTPGKPDLLKTPRVNQNVATKTPASAKVEFKKQTPASVKPEFKKKTPASGIPKLKGQSSASKISASIRNGTPLGKTRGTYFSVFHNKGDTGAKTRASLKSTPNFKFKTPLKLNQKAKDQRAGKPANFEEFAVKTRETSTLENETDNSVVIIDVAPMSTSACSLEGAKSLSKTPEKTRSLSPVKVITASIGKPNITLNSSSLLKSASKSRDSSKVLLDADFKYNRGEFARKTRNTPLKPELSSLQNCCVVLEKPGEVTPPKQELSSSKNRSVVLDKSIEVTCGSVVIDEVSELPAMSTPPQMSTKTNPVEVDKVIFKTPLKTPGRNNLNKSVSFKTPVESVADKRSKTPARSTPNASDESGLSLNLELSNVFETPAKTPGRLTRNSTMINDTSGNMSASGLENTPKSTTRGRATRNSTTVHDMKTNVSLSGFDNTTKSTTPGRTVNMSASAFNETPKSAKKPKTPAKLNLSQTEENVESKEFDATFDLPSKSPDEIRNGFVLKDATNLLETSVRVNLTRLESNELLPRKPSHLHFGVSDDSPRVTRNSTRVSDLSKATDASGIDYLSLTESEDKALWLADLSDISGTSFKTPGRETRNSTFNTSKTIQTPISSVTKRSDISETSLETSGRVTRLSTFNVSRNVETVISPVIDGSKASETSFETSGRVTRLSNFNVSKTIQSPTTITRDVDAGNASSIKSPSIPTILLNGRALASLSIPVPLLRKSKTHARVKSYGTELDYDESVSSTSCFDKSPLKSPIRMSRCSSSTNDISVTSTSRFGESPEKSLLSQNSENAEIRLNETYEKGANLTGHSLATPSKTPVRVTRNTPAVQAPSVLNREEVLDILNETYSPEKRTLPRRSVTHGRTTPNTSVVNVTSNSCLSQTETPNKTLLNGTYLRDEKEARKSNLTTPKPSTGVTHNLSALESPAANVNEVFKTPGKPVKTPARAKPHTAGAKDSLSRDIDDTIDTPSRVSLKPLSPNKILSRTSGKINFHEKELDYEESILPAEIADKSNLLPPTPVRMTRNSFVVNTVTEVAKTPSKIFSAKKSQTPVNLHLHETELDYEASVLSVANSSKLKTPLRTPGKKVQDSLIVSGVMSVSKTPVKLASVKKMETSVSMGLLQSECETELDFEASLLSAADSDGKPSSTPAKQTHDLSDVNGVASILKASTSANMNLSPTNQDSEEAVSPTSVSNDRFEPFDETFTGQTSNYLLTDSSISLDLTGSDIFKTPANQRHNSSVINFGSASKTPAKMVTVKTPAKQPLRSSVVNNIVPVSKTPAKSVSAETTVEQSQDSSVVGEVTFTRKTPAKTPAKQLHNSSVDNVAPTPKTSGKAVKTPAKPQHSSIASNVASASKTRAKMHLQETDLDYEGLFSVAEESNNKFDTPLKTPLRQTRDTLIKDSPVSPKLSIRDIFRTPAKSTPVQTPTSANPNKSKVTDQSVNIGALISSALHTANDIENTSLISPLKSISKNTTNLRSSLNRSAGSPLTEINVYQSLTKSNSAVRRTRTPLKDTSNSFNSPILSPRQDKDSAKTPNNIALSRNMSEAALLEAVIGKEINASLEVLPSKKLTKSARKSSRHSLTSPDSSFEMKDLSATSSKLTVKNASPMLLDKLFNEVRSKASLPSSNSPQSQVSQYVSAVLHWNTEEPSNGSIVSLDTTAYDFNAVQTPIVPKDIFVSPLRSDSKSSQGSGTKESKGNASRSILKQKRLSSSLIKSLAKKRSGSFSKRSSGSSSKRNSFTIPKKRVSTGKTSKRTLRFHPDVLSSPETTQTSVTESAMGDDGVSIFVPLKATRNTRTARKAKTSPVAKRNTRRKTIAEPEVQVVKPAARKAQPKAKPAAKLTKRSSIKAAVVDENSPVVPAKKSKLSVESTNENSIPSQRSRRTTRAKAATESDNIANTETLSTGKKRKSKQIEQSEILVEKRRKTRQAAEIAEENDSPLPTRRRTRAVVEETKKPNKKASIVKESEETIVAQPVRKGRGKALPKTKANNVVSKPVEESSETMEDTSAQPRRRGRSRAASKTNKRSSKVVNELVEESCEEDSVAPPQRKGRGKAAPSTRKQSSKVVNEPVEESSEEEEEESVVPPPRKSRAKAAPKTTKRNSKVTEQAEEDFVTLKRNTRSKVVTETQSKRNSRNIATEEIEATSLFDRMKCRTRGILETVKKTQTKKQSVEVVEEETTAPKPSKKSGKKSTSEEVSASLVKRGGRSRSGQQAGKLSNRPSSLEQIIEESAPRTSRRASSKVAAEPAKLRVVLKKIQTPSPVQKKTRSRAVAATARKSVEKVASPVVRKTRAKAVAEPSKSKKKVSFPQDQRVTRSRK